MNAPQKPMRLAMPETAAFIDACREAFGADQINPSLKNGAQGGSDFYARENGHTIGSPLADTRPPLEKTCRNCAHWQRLKMGATYCSSARPDLAPAYGQSHPLRRLPADNGATCNHYQPQD